MRYFLEVFYKGTGYAGFQVQQNAVTIQSELEKALGILLKEKPVLTGSSRTDAGVHAEQNFFHFDLDGKIDPGITYNLNAILPGDIAVRQLIPVKEGAHCRFDAIARRYRYSIYRFKNPFQADRAYFFPYRMDIDHLNQMAEVLKGTHDFTSFSKRNTQVRTFTCSIEESWWEDGGEVIHFHITGNRFLRGMVRGLVGTMIRLGRKGDAGGVDTLRNILGERNCSAADFSVPARGLCLEKVVFSEGYFGEVSGMFSATNGNGHAK